MGASEIFKKRYKKKIKMKRRDQKKVKVTRASAIQNNNPPFLKKKKTNTSSSATGGSDSSSSDLDNENCHMVSQYTNVPKRDGSYKILPKKKLKKPTTTKNQNHANHPNQNIGGLPISINELIEALPQDTNEEDNKFIDKLKSE